MTDAPIEGIEAATVLVSLELSKRSWLVASLPPDAKKISLRTLPGGDGQALLDYLAKLRKRVADKVGSVVVIRLCFEIGYDGFWLARLLLANGVDTYVLDPASFLVSRRGKRVKTDRIDAEAMVGILKAYLAGDHSVCRVVNVPTVEEEDARRLMRERKELVAERTSQIGRIRGLLALHGIRQVRAIKGGDGLPQLDDMRTGDGRALPPHLRAEIERCFGRLALLNDQLKAVECDRSAIMASTATTFPCREKAMLLERLKGIGPGSATMLVAEIFCRQFANRRQLASFIGLAPSPYSSGSVERDQGISKAGNKGARVLLVELTWCWLRYQPGSELSIWYRDRFTGRGKRSVKVGIIALARKLLIALWRYVETGLVPRGAELRAAS
jgi:transposase